MYVVQPRQVLSVARKRWQSRFPAEAAALEGGYFHGFQHDMERLGEVQLPGAGKAAGFVFEADGVGRVHLGISRL